MRSIEGVQHYTVREFNNLREMIEQSVELYADKTAFRFRPSPQAEPQTKTYAEFQADIQALGTCLMDMALGGGRIAVIGDNSYAWCVVHAAVINGVGVIVPLDRLLPEEEIIDLLERGDVQALFYDSSFQDIAVKAAEKLSGLRKLFCLRPERLKNVPADFWAAPDADRDHSVLSDKACYYRMDDCLIRGQTLHQQGAREYLLTDIDHDTLASLLFTSGTTSSAKAVMLSHKNICADIRGLAAVVQLPPQIRMLSVLPLHHTFENTCGFYMALYVGAQIHESDGLRYIQKNLNDYGIEMIIGVPLLFNNFYSRVQDALKKSGKDKLIRKLIPVTQALRKVHIDLRRVFYKQIIAAFGGHLRLGICGAAPIDPDIIRFFDAVGFRILEGYGLTESAPVASGCNTKVFVPGTVGQPLYGVTVAIDTDESGDTGEILVRGDNVMRGYYQQPEATAEAIDQDGWLHTGDIGRIDSKTKCITITGRLKSMIVLKTGKKIFPEEIEHLIAQNKLIKESLVWGEMDEDGEIVVSAKFILDREQFAQTEGHIPDEQSIRQMLDQLIQDINARMPTFKGIRHYVYGFQEMVKTTTLKVKRPIEIEKMSQLMQKQHMKWRQLTGKNIDQLASDDQEKTLEQPAAGGVDGKQGKS